MTDRIDTLEDVTRALLAHQAENVAWWEEQRRQNLTLDRRIERIADDGQRRLDSHSGRISAVERKVYLMAGAAAAGGGLIGNLASLWFQGG